MEQAGKDGLRHLVPDQEISIGCSIVLRASRDPLPEGTIGISQLPFTGEKSGEDERARVETVFGGILNFWPADSGS